MGNISNALNDLFNNELSQLGEIYRGSVPTHFDYLDYLNAKRNANTQEIERGISSGKILYIAGNSGSGKSSLAIKAAMNIIGDSDDGMLIVFDAEKSNSHERICALSGLSIDDYNENYRNKRVRLINVGTNIDNLHTLVASIHRAKMVAGTDATFTKKEGMKISDDDTYRRQSTELPPTVIIVDSWAMIAPKKIDDSGEMRGAMDPAMIAKANNAFIKSNADRFYEANITFIIINHITTDISIGPVQTDERPIKWLKPKEKLPGGNTAIYLADTLVRMEQKEAIKEDKELGIHGFMVDVLLAKSRNNASGRRFYAVFDPYIGIDNTLTNYIALKANGYITGGGRGYALSNLPEVKFSQRDVREVYKKNREFRKRFNELVEEYMSKFITDIEADETKDDEEGTSTTKKTKSLPAVTRRDIMKMKKSEIKTFIKENNLDIDPSDYILAELREAVAEIWEEKQNSQEPEETSEDITEEEALERIDKATSYKELNKVVELCGFEAISEDDYESLDEAKEALKQAITEE